MSRSTKPPSPPTSTNPLADHLINVLGFKPSPSNPHELTGCCPHPDHDDTTPSFGFNVEKGAFHCFGCDRSGNGRELAAMLGVAYDERPTTTSDQPIQTRVFVYGKDGKPLRRKVREDGHPDGKHCWWEHPGDGRGFGGHPNWVAGQGDAEPIIYNHDAVRAAAGTDQLVLFCEGEPKADQVTADGFVGTTVGGVDSWRAEHAAQLADCDVVILPDYDQAGYDHAAKVVQDIIPHAASVSWLDLPGLNLKEDVIDWRTDHSVAELHKQVKAAIRIRSAADIPPSPHGGAAKVEEDDAPPLNFWGDADLTGPPGLGLPPELDLDYLPAIIAAMATDEAARLGVDPALIAIPALAVCAGAIDDAHRVQVRRRDTGWTESARLWVGVVVEPGGGKTPALKRVVAPLRAVEQRWQETDRVARSDYDLDFKQYARERGKWARTLTIPEPIAPTRPPVRRRVVGDTTTEALGMILADNPSGVLAVFDELSAWIGSIDAYRERTANIDRGRWLSLYEGGPTPSDRIGRGHTFVPNWSCSLVGGIQPGPFKRLFGKIQDDGLIARLIIVWTRDPVRGIDRAPDADAGAAYDRLITQLVGLPAPATPYTLAPAAHTAREIIATLARNMLVLPTTSAAMKAHLAKWEGLYARLLLTYHLAEHADGPRLVISGETAQRVTKLMARFLLPHAKRLYAELDGNAHAQHTRWIAGYILAHNSQTITAREIGRVYGELRGEARAIAEAMDVMALANWVTPVDRGRPGSPLSRWQVNPAVHSAFARQATAERERREAERRKIAIAIKALGRMPKAGIAE